MIKFVSVLCALALSSCSTYHVQRYYHGKEGKVEMSQAVAFGEECYKTEQEIPVFQFDSECPTKKVVDADLRRLFKRLDITDTKPYRTLRITFVSKNIICGPYGQDDNLEVHGCSNPATNQITVRLYGTRASWAKTMAHEVGHFVILWGYPKSYGDPAHLAVSVWNLIEAIDDE